MDKSTSQSLTSRIICTKFVNWKQLQFIQQQEFKELPSDERQKLKQSLLANNFVDPFNVWEDSDNSQYCLDGKHRTIILHELEQDGVNVPEMLPANIIQCADKKDAAKLVLIYSSAYARVTQQGFTDFMAMYDLPIPELLTEISIPDLTFAEMMPVPENLDGDSRNKPATMKITFDTYQQLEHATEVIKNLLNEQFPGAFFSVSFGEI